MTVDEMRTEWNEWCKGFLALKPNLMSGIVSRAMVNMTFAERSDSMIPVEIAETFPFKVLDSRAKHIGLDMSEAATAFISLALAEGNPGICVMYAHALRYAQLERGIGKIDMSIICIELFPNGFPSTEDMSKHWDEQKGYKLADKYGRENTGFDNMLDRIGGLAAA